MDNLTKAQRTYNMSSIRSTNTQLEQKFLGLLDSYKINYEKHPKLYGKPDCIVNGSLLIFVDSDFWHGWRYKFLKDKMLTFSFKKPYVVLLKPDMRTNVLPDVYHKGTNFFEVSDSS